MKITVLISNLDAELFKQQRRTLTEIISSVELSQEQYETLEGLQNLLDEIADQAHDKYGLDTLYLSEDKDL